MRKSKDRKVCEPDKAYFYFNFLSQKLAEIGVTENTFIDSIKGVLTLKS